MDVYTRYRVGDHPPRHEGLPSKSNTSVDEQSLETTMPKTLAPSEDLISTDEEDLGSDKGNSMYLVRPAYSYRSHHSLATSGTSSA